jgi:transposase-like protein
MPTYTKADKEKAVALYLEHGAGHAAAELGCDRTTIYAWLGSHNVGTKTTDERRAETEARHTARREALREVLADKALALACALDPSDPNLRNIATAMGITIDKLRLELGESTGRQEHVGLSAVDIELQRALDELTRASTL